MANPAHGGPADRPLWPPSTTVCASILAAWSVWTLQRTWAARRHAEFSSAGGGVLVPHSRRDTLVLRTKSALAWLGALVQLASLAVKSIGLVTVPNGASGDVFSTSEMIARTALLASLALFSTMASKCVARPSLVVFVALVTTVVFDGLRLWALRASLCAANGWDLLTVSAVAGAVVDLLLLLLEFVTIQALYAMNQDYSPEFAASIPSLAVFAWTRDLVRLGSSKFLGMDDLWHVHPRDQSAELLARFDDARRRHPDAGLIRHLLSMFGSAWLRCLGLAAIGSLLMLQLPLLVKSLIALLSDPLASQADGIALAFGYLGVTAISVVFYESYFYAVFLSVMHVRSLIMAALYRKVLRSPLKTAQAANVLNHMQVDAEAMANAVNPLIWSPIAVFEIIYGFTIIYMTVGPVAIAGMGIMGLAVVVNFVIGRMQLGQMESKLKLMDDRIAATSQVIHGMRTLKLYGWAGHFRDKIRTVRSAEMLNQRWSMNLKSIQGSIFTVLPTLATAVMFGVTTLVWRVPLSTDRVFMTLSAVSLTKDPIHFTTWAVNMILHGIAAFRRIRDFLDTPDQIPYVQHDTQDPDNAVEIVNGSFSWDSDKSSSTAHAVGAEPSETTRLLDSVTASAPAMTLSDINLQIRAGSLTAIVGEVGSSKSSLLAAMLGEIPKCAGTVRTRGRVAYVSQKAWIINATVRENVLFGLPMDEARYQRVIDACALESDLAMLAQGDQTLIGDKGINLSGGQRARVSLARAVYMDADIYLFDDPLSAVDAHVDRHLFAHILSSETGLLKDKTRVLVTHGIHHVMDGVDQVVVCHQGQIVEQGAPAPLAAKLGGHFATMMDHHRRKVVHHRSTTETATARRSKSPIRAKTAVTTHSGYSSVESGSDADSAASDLNDKLDDGKAVIESQPSDGDDTEEDMVRGSVSFDVFVKYLRYIGAPAILFFLALQVTVHACDILFTYWTGYWADASDGTAETDGWYLTGLLGIQSLNFSFGLGSWLFYDYVTVRAAMRISDVLLEKITRLPLSFFDVTPSGRVLNRFTKDLSTIEEDLPSSLSSLLWLSLHAVFMLMSIIIATPWFIALLIPMGMMFMHVQRQFGAVSRELRRLESVSKSPIFQLFSETVDGLATIRASRHSVRFLGMSESLIDTNARAKHPMITMQRWLTIHLRTLAAMILFLTALFAALSIGAMTPARAVLIGVSLIAAQDATWVFEELVREFCNVEIAAIAVERIQGYADLEPEADEETRPEVQLEQDWPQHGVVEFQDFSVAYRPGLPLVLRDVTLSTFPGEKVAIVGRTGSGKSSLSQSLFRIMEANTGRIVIDGRNLASLGLQDVRSRITILPQDAFIFDGSVRENVDPLNTASDSEIWAALDAAQLKEVVQNLPDKLEEPIKGVLSAGQSQLLCLARAIIRRSKVLVLDEATASVDHATDELVQRSIRTTFRDCTVFTIAHRIGTILDYDRVLVLDQGRVVEFDTPSALLGRPDSLFYQLAKRSNLIK
ncbi:hypothetical protein AMAG_15656 [Allomyces macrogynus ATCC 38327]|uniref:Multi drug resistance-associated protein n=1 Tax=Allomyces macrogynus (strain ATCC 38327) TaxID=578462 RepID=A0A0L0T9D9_ALLM3|nr:hypothetical protein AMAG_15656 [Allomyces macrogynus ATCC 38327]|eukprot:KNE71423.1 hypothetical protein AMAG_15656 [Allomyces macrogynus ATCC 38327]